MPTIILICKMNEFWILILVAFFAINSLDKAESVQLFDEIFGEGWWDNDKAEEWHKLTLEQTFPHQIDRQNTQIGQIEANSTDQNLPLTESDHFGQIEPNTSDQNLPLTESDHFGQIEPNTSDQNPPLTESDHSDNDNGEEQNEIKEITNENIDEDERKRKIIDKFNAMKDEFKQKGKYSANEWTQIEIKIAKHLKVSRTKIYEWKKQFGQSQKKTKNELKNLVEKFDQRKTELKRAGLKNSYPNQINETVAKELRITDRTISNWKRKLGQTKPNHKHSHNEQLQLMKCYYGIKDKTPKISDWDIAKMLKISRATLYIWKRQFKRQQFHPNSVDGHSVEENAAENVQEIEKTNLN